MKTAIPSNDGKTISAHFGRSKGFIVFETSGNEILNEEYRENNVTGHVLGQHHEHENGNNDHHAHSHTGILGALSDCEMVIAGGMGQGLFNDLQAAGKIVFMTREVIAQEALRLLLANKLDTDAPPFCQH